MAGGNQQVDGLPLIPDPTGADVYAPKGNVDYRVRTGQAGGLATLDGTGKLLAAQKPAYTKSEVGLGNVDNTSDVNKPVSTATQTALNLKANLASPALTGIPTAPTAAVGTNTTQLASTAFVQAEIANDAPTKVGGGASGTWGISITGAAPFAGITGKPTTLAGYGITDAMATSWTLTAGNGLTGGGTGAANRTLTLGTPGSTSLASTNAVTATSHTHAFAPGGTTAQYIRGDGSLATTPLGTVTSITAGNGMNFTTITSTGAVTLGVPSDITGSTTNAVTATSHTHAINYGSVVASAYNDLTQHIKLHTGNYGFSITSGALNYVVPSAAIHAFYVGSAQAMSFDSAIWYGNAKAVVRTNDTWLRFNPNGDFTSGIHLGTGLTRADGNFQVGTTSLNGFFTSPTVAPQWKGIELGYRNVPLTTTNANYTFVADDAGKARMHTDATARIYTIPAVYAAGDVLTIVNSASGGLTLTGSGVSLFLAPGSTGAGNRTLGTRAIATVFFISSTQALVYGVGVS